MKKKYLFFVPALLLLAGCGSGKLLDEGVSRELALWRRANYSDVRYGLHFTVPEDRSQPVSGEVTVELGLSARERIILDFTGSAEDIHSVVVNGVESRFKLRNQHIIIPAGRSTGGRNTVEIKFTAADRPLNRRDEFLYTLLVPDRARTLFPCFEQPDMKGRFTLSLTLPEEWAAVGNGSVLEERPAEQGQKRVLFRETEPISTYLFSFVCGRFERLMQERGGREISVYHRETDPAKAAQCDVIFDEVFHSLGWIEEYTGIPYPFEKYDLVILPGFQYGGMEHMGATLYNDRRMFLEANATEAERLGRSSLIAHETAHMWFGDLVTMEWFSDVWNKEVFANWFAARIVRPMYPDVNHDINFLRSHIPGAYADDRSGGSVPVQQRLDNLSQAGLVYGNIIYDKSPVVMDMLVRKVGEERFREGIREYLRRYAYGNTNWDGLVDILDGLTDEDLRGWSDVWVKEKGMPVLGFAIEAGGEADTETLLITQGDPWGREMLWEQDIALAAVAEKGTYALLEAGIKGRYTKLDLPPDTKYILPNMDGRGYGYFRQDSLSEEWLLENWSALENEVSRYSMLINLHEGLLAGNIAPERFFASVTAALPAETNFQIFRQALACSESCARLFFRDDPVRSGRLESVLFDMAKFDDDPQRRTAAVQSYIRAASTPEAVAELYRMWAEDDYAGKFGLSESDLVSISYELAVRYPEDAEWITGRQLERITNPDRRAEYEFVSRAVSASDAGRDAFFADLLDARNRGVEPWAARALRLLNHPVREAQAVKYIRPGLEALREVQRTGDIFFPANWLAALLGGHSSVEALREVESFLHENPRYPNLLAGKVRLKADHLYIINGEQEKRYGN